MDYLTFFSSPSLVPELSSAMTVFICKCYGFLLLLFLFSLIPNWNRIFVSERFGGYIEKSKLRDVLHSKIGASVLLALWLASSTCILIVNFPTPFLFLNLILSGYFFVSLRWKSVSRGCGAPGFMTYWLGFACFLISALAPVPSVQNLAILVLQVDFAFIMLSAGIYKFTAGYRVNEGMEYGLVNPEWGYWWKKYRKISPRSWIFKWMNFLAWSTEVVAGVMMLIPSLRLTGSLLIFLSFIFIATQIRLALLCPMVMVSCLIFFHPNSLFDRWLTSFSHSTIYEVPSTFGALYVLVKFALYTYLCLLPLAHLGLFYNFYGNRKLPQPIQKLLESYANFFGIIIWRVFSIDVINFYVFVFRQEKTGDNRTLISKYGDVKDGRFNHVCESIAVTSIFTTLKYYSANKALFRERLLRYCRSIPCSEGQELVFEYYSIQKKMTGFETLKIREFSVAPHCGIIEERVVDANISIGIAAEVSPAREGVKPGSYLSANNS